MTLRPARVCVCMEDVSDIYKWMFITEDGTEAGGRKREVDMWWRDVRMDQRSEYSKADAA